MIFLNSESEDDITLIKGIIKLFSSKEKYPYLRYLWWYIKNDDLSNKVLQILKDNAPNYEELSIIESLSPPVNERIGTTLLNFWNILEN